MKIPDPLQVAMARSGRGRVMHVVDWRRSLKMHIAVCDHPIGPALSGDEIVSRPGLQTCSNCRKIISELRMIKVYVGEEHIDVSGLTPSQIVELAIKHQIPPDAEFGIRPKYHCCGDIQVVLQWSLTE